MRCLGAFCIVAALRLVVAQDEGYGDGPAGYGDGPTGYGDAPGSGYGPPPSVSHKSKDPVSSQPPTTPKAPPDEGCHCCQSSTFTSTVFTTLYNTTTVSVTVTERQTSTVVAHTTDSVTVTKPLTATQTLLVPTVSILPTTIENRQTVTQVHVSSTTIWQSTTYTATTTYSTERVVTITSDHTVVATTIKTEYVTTVATITSSYPVVSEITKLVTQTATATVTATGQATTVTREAQTRERTVTLTRVLPAQTVTVTRNGETVVSTLPASTTILTKTLPGSTVVLKTTLLSPPLTVTNPQPSVCPSPTGRSAPLPPKSNLTFGCRPGSVCNPPKPNGCSIWPGPPSDDFLCEPSYCIPSPPIRNATWREGETSFYPVSYGYFNLNPEAFGLSYDIFSFEVVERVQYGQTVTVTTGNWASQTTLSDWPRTTKAKPTKAANPYHHRRNLEKRTVTPSICYDNCNEAYLIAASTGKTDALCRAGSSFHDSYALCTRCIEANSGASKATVRDYVAPQFAQVLFRGG
ncbi:hypothetical protein CDD80_6547 [Ophiocordyceps camponoti-rufipedis]|uniref:Glycoprotein X n=1 Tax=Ophiocordyceps camponoti-rufipedis TaxID=2004952 RepID=A0A2C5Z9W1_9HYPO|nr:hypothetical protein CDD80_6547 [Ophiocordyceps camponoti-rufipedis]